MISIFARPSYLGNLYPRHTKELNTHRLSSRIRGEEMAEYMGAKLNPRSGYENDVLIYVKPTGFKHIRDGAFIDILDGLQKGRIELLKKRPKIKVIAASKNSFDFLKKELPNKVTCIPHHHINFERFKRTKRKINTCGYIGGPSPLAFKVYKEIGKELKKMGMEFIACFNYKTRQDAVDFYKKIDILVVGTWQLGDRNPIYKIPTKIINAMSFGIPSVAFPMKGYKEIERYYVRASNMKELLTEVEKFKDKDYYKKWSGKVLKMSEKYHISEIAKLYKKLK